MITLHVSYPKQGHYMHVPPEALRVYDFFQEDAWVDKGLFTSTVYDAEDGKLKLMTVPPEGKIAGFVTGELDSTTDSMGAALQKILDKSGAQKFGLGVRVAPFVEPYAFNGKRGIAYVMVAGLWELPNNARAGAGEHCVDIVEVSYTNQSLAKALNSPIHPDKLDKMRQHIDPEAPVPINQEAYLTALRELLSAFEAFKAAGGTVSKQDLFVMHRTETRLSCKVDWTDVFEAGAVSAVEAVRTFPAEGPLTHPDVQ